jgi:hypothetical protein
MGQMHRRQVVDKQVDVIVFAVELDEPGVEICADLGHHLLAAVEHRGGEHIPAVLGSEDQMHMQLGDDASSPAKLRFIGPSW